MPFESPAIVELMGHSKIAGKVSEQVIAGMAMLRVDVPKTSKREGYTKFYSANAVYCITPTDEATANRAAEAFDIEPISPWVLRIPESPMLADKTRPSDEFDQDYAGYYDDDYDDYDDFDDGDDEQVMPVTLTALNDINELSGDDEDLPDEDEEARFAAELKEQNERAKDVNEAQARVAAEAASEPQSDESDSAF